jgi:hypothetical protein
MANGIYRILVVAALAILIGPLAACSGGTAVQTATEEPLRAAETVLASYFDNLAAGNYAAAAEQYGGSYETLLYYNPDVDPEDQAALLERACTVNGFVCLSLRQIVEANEAGGDQFRFQVEFQDSDGSLFVLGPCCGASAEEMPPVSTFDFEVRRTEGGRYLVMDLPVNRP